MVSVAAFPGEFDCVVVACSLSWLVKCELKLEPQHKTSIKLLYEGKDVIV